MPIDRKIDFWATHNEDRLRPIDFAVRRIKPQDALKFVRGCWSVFEQVDRFNPDVIFFPERGATPLNWGIEAVESYMDGVNRTRVFLPIGTFTDVHTGKNGGISEQQKEIIVQKVIGHTINSYGMPRRPMVMDEVQTGGTITQAANIIHRTLSVIERTGIVGGPKKDSKPLYVLGVEDEREGTTYKLSASYKRLISNTRPHIRSAVVRMPLFTIDRPEFLNYLFEAPNASHFRMPMVMHNIEAEAFIKGLVTVAMDSSQVDTILQQLIILNGQHEDRVPDSAVEKWYRDLVQLKTTNLGI